MALTAEQCRKKFDEELTPKINKDWEKQLAVIAEENARLKRLFQRLEISEQEYTGG